MLRSAGARRRLRPGQPGRGADRRQRRRPPRLRPGGPTGGRRPTACWCWTTRPTARRPKPPTRWRRSTCGRWPPTARCSAPPSPAGPWSAPWSGPMAPRCMVLPPALLDAHAPRRMTHPHDCPAAAGFLTAEVGIPNSTQARPLRASRDEATERQHERTDESRHRREFPPGRAGGPGPRAGRFLGRVVRPLQGRRPDPRRAGPGLRRQAHRRQGRHRREPGDAERVRGARHPDHAAVPRRQAARPEGRAPCPRARSRTGSPSQLEE